MKSIIVIFAAFLVATTGAFAQKNIPAAAKAAFTKANPTATDVKWDKESNGTFEANCKINGVSSSLVYDKMGVLQETETEIAVAEIPAAVTEAVHKKYPKATITGGDKIVNNKGVVKYEVDLKTGKKETEKQFDETGKEVR